jgi:hypothetical protein
MRRVRIIGGGLTGILAAFEAHRLGCRDIELHERFDRLGGVALPRMRDGLELRDSRHYFGPRGDPLRGLLEWHGLAFEDFERHCGSVTPDRAGRPRHVSGFDGPALACRPPFPAPAPGVGLASRLRAYPAEAHAVLARYCHWRLGAWLDRVHVSAALPLGVDRVLPLGVDLADMGGFPADLFAMPGAQPDLASLPREGFTGFFQACHRKLQLLGVRIHLESLVSPRHLVVSHGPDDIVVWASHPMPLFEAVGLPRPAPWSKTFASHVFRARWSGPAPFHAQNFTAQGSVFRAYVYRSRGETLVTAECVGETSDADLRREVRGLLAGFGADLELGESLAFSLSPNWSYLTTDAHRALGGLRAALARLFGAAFVPGAWEAYAQPDKFTEVNAGLAAALGQASREAAAA